MGSRSEIVLGIDLGTTNSACAVVQDGRASVVRRGTERIIPSMVALMDDGSIAVGEAAQQRRITHPTQCVFGAKRLIGHRYGSPQVQRMKRAVPYRIVEGTNETVMVELGNRRFSIVEISAYILKYLRQMSEEALGERVRKCVIAVPAGFTDSQRSATRVAARLAGLDVLRVINEPTAAALAYGYVEDVDRRLAVYDFGGGTFDVTILQITRNVFEVLSSSGEMFLGGDDIDEAILERMVTCYEREKRVTIRHNVSAVQRLRVAAEQIKQDLSEEIDASVTISEVVPGTASEFIFRLTQSDMGELIDPIVRRTQGICEQALASAGIGPKEVDEVVLVGGTTKIPLVRKMAEESFLRSPQVSINPMSVVAVGAAIQGAALLGSLVPMADVDLPVPVGEAVLLDVTPRSLGVATVGGYVDFVIERNSVIPTEQSRLFTTTVDNQKHVLIQVCEGDGAMFDDNTKLGEILLSDIVDAPRGEPTIAVTFEINSDGLLEVRALDQDSGQEQVATIRVAGELSERELEALAKSSSFSDSDDITTQTTEIQTSSLR